MTKYLNFLVTIVLILFSIYFYNRTEHLNSRIETIGNNTSHYFYCDSQTTHYLEMQRFREDSYIRQQEHDTNLILFIFGVTVTILTVASWRIGKDELETIRKEILRYKHDQNESNSKYQNYLEETRGQLNFETYITRTQDALRYWDDNKPISIMLWLASNTYLTGYYIFKLKHEPDKANEELLKLRAGLAKLLDKIGKDEITMTGVNQATIDGTLGAIMQTKDEISIALLNQIRLKLRFTS